MMQLIQTGTIAMENFTPDNVLKFWFEDIEPATWWKVDPDFDAGVRMRFQPALEAAASGTFDHWTATPDGALALIILLDQLSRNIFRGQARAFEQDAKALAVAKEAISREIDMKVPADRRAFFYMPFMHSENLAFQDKCIALVTERLGPDSGTLGHAKWHRDVIAEFGRFPFRNRALGRETTAAEAEWLEGRSVPGQAG